MRSPFPRRYESSDRLASAAAPSSSEVAGGPSPRPTRVLVVDDEVAIQRIFKTALSNYGFTTLSAGDGREALDILGREPIDVIVTDVHMPGCGGLKLLELLRERHATVPVIVMSGRPVDSVMSQALLSGAFHYLVKPIMPSALRGEIEGALAAAKR